MLTGIVGPSISGFWSVRKVLRVGNLTQPCQSIYHHHNGPDKGVLTRSMRTKSQNFCVIHETSAARMWWLGFAVLWSAV